MRNKRFATAARASLLVVCALLISTTALASTLGYYNWTATTTGFVGEFTNKGTGGGVKANTQGTSSIGLYGYATGSTAQATRGYNTGTGYGVYGRSVNGTGVYGENNGTSGGYGGYFTGFYGARGVATTWGGWFSSYQSNGVGVRGYSDGENGYGVYGSNPENIALYGDGGVWGGYFLGTGEGVDTGGAYGYTAGDYGDAFQGQASGYSGWGVNVSTTGESGRGVNASTSGAYAYAGYFSASNYRGLYANAVPANQYDLYVPDYAYIAGHVFTPGGGESFLARNDSGGVLEPGDVVIFLGLDAPALDGSVLSVSLAGAQAGAVIGVVQGAYAVDEVSARPAVTAAQPAAMPLSPPSAAEAAPAPVPDDEVPAAGLELHEEVTAVVEAPPPMPGKSGPTEADTGHFVGGAVQAGQYLLVASEGLVTVRVRADSAIQAGDWIVVAPSGSVTGAPARAYSRVLDRGYSILGRAMQPLAAGEGLVLVRLDLR